MINYLEEEIDGFDVEGIYKIPGPKLRDLRFKDPCKKCLVRAMCRIPCDPRINYEAFIYLKQGIYTAVKQFTGKVLFYTFIFSIFLTLSLWIMT